MKASKILQNYLGCVSLFGRVDKNELYVISVIQEYRKHIASVLWYHSGGGCNHIFHHLKDGRILILHTEGGLEVTYDKYESVDAYLELDEEDGLGWEYEKPDWDNRIYGRYEDDDLNTIKSNIKKLLS